MTKKNDMAVMESIKLVRMVDDAAARAVRTVLNNTHSAEEARALLEMLGLDPTAVRPAQEAITA